MASMSISSMMKMTAGSSSSRVGRCPGTHRRIAFVLLLSCVLLSFACTTPAPEGEPIDMEAMRTFQPFNLKGLDGRTHGLTEYLDKITLVSFFFPT